MCFLVENKAAESREEKRPGERAETVQQEGSKVTRHLCQLPLPFQEAKVLIIDCQLLFSTDSLLKEATKSVHS